MEDHRTLLLYGRSKSGRRFIHSSNCRSFWEPSITCVRIGPEYARIADPLRALLKPLAEFPPNERQLQAIEELKELVIQQHYLCVPDEAAAIEAANAWLSGAPPAGKPYETGADTSGYAIGGVCG